ncbi:MAG: TauD/TfdA family dioxygenase [Acidimicrobiia bacterium]
MEQLVVRRDSGPPVVAIERGGELVPLPALWLRERSQDPSQVDLVSAQRLVDPHRFPIDLEVVDAHLEGTTAHVAFSDGHAAAFDRDALLRSAIGQDLCPPVRPWRADLSPLPVHDWRAMVEDGPFLAALGDFLELGFVVLQQTPTEPGTVLDVAARFGFVRETNFGRLFDVRSYPDSNDLAYRPIPLGPHTDNPYRSPVPGIQLLHCLVNDTSGGLSTLVDGIAVTEALRAEDPEASELLATLPVRFRFRDADTELVSWQPVIAVDARGVTTGLRYSPRLDEMPVMDVASTRRYQAARRRLGELLVQPEYEVRFRLQPGELMMFDNDRVLHGRTGFDPQEGMRHLQGCYIDHDAPRSRYRVLCRDRSRI